MRLTSAQRQARGDTIIEVVFAIVIFSFVAISSLMIMNRGIATGEKALEITLVRQQVNAQAEALRYIHGARVVSPTSAHADTWERLTTEFAQPAASSFGANDGVCEIESDGGFNPFVLNARTAEVWTNTPSIEPDPDLGLPPYSQVVYNEDSSVRAAYGIWVESVPSGASEPKHFVDFHIRACWPAPGSAVPMTIGTIVRLYDPS